MRFLTGCFLKAVFITVIISTHFVLVCSSACASFFFMWFQYFLYFWTLFNSCSKRSCITNKTRFIHLYCKYAKQCWEVYTGRYLQTIKILTTESCFTILTTLHLSLKHVTIPKAIFMIHQNFTINNLMILLISCHPVDARIIICISFC